jgi:hypothetical protein
LFVNRTRIAERRLGWRSGDFLNRLALRENAGNQGQHLADAIFTAELVNAATRIDDLLFSGIKRMTGGANLNQEVFAERGTRRKLVSATTGYFNVTVVWVNIGFHVLLSGALESAKRARNI